MLGKTAITVTIALLAFSCGGTAEPDVLDVPDGGSGVILEISDEGGFVPIEFSLQNVPRYTVFADATVIAPSIPDGDFPGPAVRTMQQHRLPDDVLTDLLTFVADIGLDEIVELDLNDGANVADAPTTTVRFFDDAGEHRLSIYALGFANRDARSLVVQSMISLLDQTIGTLPGAEYVPERLGVFASQEPPFAETVVEQPWPLPIAFDQMQPEVFAGYSCAVIEGSEVADTLSALALGTQGTFWMLDGQAHAVIARPLLPHQNGC